MREAGKRSHRRSGLTGAWATLVAAFSYHPSGLLSEIRHGNGVVETLELDPSGLARLGSLSVWVDGAYEALWSASHVRYDGAGDTVKVENIWKQGVPLGDQVYTYDSRGRLVAGPGVSYTAGLGKGRRDDWGRPESESR